MRQLTDSTFASVVDFMALKELINNLLIQNEEPTLEENELLLQEQDTNLIRTGYPYPTNNNDEITSLFAEPIEITHEQETIQQLVNIDEVHITKKEVKNNFFTNLIQIQRPTDTLLQQQFLEKMDRMNKLLYMIAVGIGIVVITTSVIMVNSYIANQRLKRIEKIIAEAEILSKESYSPEERLEFVLNIKEELNKILYLNEEMILDKVYAFEDGKIYMDGDISITPKIVNTTSQTEFPVHLDITKQSETSYLIAGENAGEVLVPGRYELQLEIAKGEASGTVSQNFSWGVLAINTNKSVYTPGQIAKLYLAVLDDEGQMACDAEINLEIVSPSGEKTTLSTTDGSIVVNESCKIKDIVRQSDFETSYEVGGVGEYTLNLSATTENGTHSISDKFLVKDYVSLDIERITATRIYPLKDYPVIIKVIPNEAFAGKVNEYMSNNFKPVIPEQEVLTTFMETEDIEYDFYDDTTISKLYGNQRKLSWNVDWQAGETYYLAYGYDAPDISPDYYTLGPLRAEATVSGNNFTEFRKWQIAVDAASAFRVTEYYLTTGDFTGTTYDLTLDNILADDYFILIRGSRTGDASSNPDNDFARVYEVPDGTGELGDSGSSNVISLSRYVADHDWEGVVTVVECVADTDQAGFKLLDIVETSISASSTSGTDTSGTAWSDIDDVVLFGGFHGGGAEFESAANADDGNAVETRLYPSSTSTLNWERNSSQNLSAVTLTTFVIEWGSEWTVQRVNVSGNANGNGCDATGEYGTGTISSVTRDNTWVWGTGNSDGAGIGDNVDSTIITLGDGVNQNTSETTVAYCGEYNHTKDLDIYTMTHSDLAVDYRFKSDGDTDVLDLDVTVDSATDGYRFGWVTNSVNGSGSLHPRDRFWARYTADTTITISRGHDGQPFPAWVEGIDFNDVDAQVPVTNQKHFRWRDDSTDLNTSGGWLAAEDASITDTEVGTTYRLRLEVSNGGGAVETSSKSYELEWGLLGTNPTCGTVTTWTGVGDTSDAIDMAATTHIDPDGETTSALLANTESYTFTAGEGRDTSDTTSAIGPMSSLYYTELEYSIQPTASASAGETYCFRVTNSGAAIDLYEKYPTLTMKADKMAVGEVGQVTTDYQGTTVTFRNRYENPVVIAESISVDDGTGAANRPAAAMIKSIDGTGFTVRIQETDSENDDHGDETFGWIVMEEGSWELSNGLLVDAGTASLAASNYWNGGSAYTCAFSQTFVDTPAIFTALQTDNNTGTVDFLTSMMDNPTSSNFDCFIGIEDGGSGNPTTGETFGWIAFEQGTGTINDIDYEFGDTGTNVHGYSDTWYTQSFTQSFSSAPIIVATRNDGNGADEGWVRYDNLSSTSVDLAIDENDDSDRSHLSTDGAYYAAFDSSGDLTAKIGYEQAAYRWFQNSNSLDVGDTMASQDTAVFFDENGDTARLRLLIDVNGQMLRRYGQNFKLQYASKSGSCDTAFSGESYADVTTTTPIAYYNNSSPTDGQALTDNANDPSHGGETVINQTYEEANNFSNDISEVETNEDAMWDFSLYDYNAPVDATYCLRVVTSDGITLGNYTSIPEITATGINISGTAYTDSDELTALSGVDICSAVDSTFDSSDCDTTDGSGNFSIFNVPAIAGNEQLTIFVDGATNGNVVTIGDGDHITGLKLYQNHIIPRYETGTTITIANMDAYDNDQNATDILFDAEAAATDTLSWESGSKLFIPSGYTFTPGGNLNGHDIEIVGAYTASTGETINIDGSWNHSGTFTPSISTVTFDATSGTEDVFTTGAGAFYNLVFNDGGGGATWEIEDSLDVNGNLTITSGTVDVVNGENNQINIAGNYTNDGTFEARSGLVVFDGNTNATLDSGCADADTCTSENFYDVRISKSEGSSVTLSSTPMRTQYRLHVAQGIFNQGAEDFRTDNLLTIDEGGQFWSIQTGDLTLGGNATVNGQLTINANGMTCGDADSISITSTSTTQRSWSGSGAIRISDAAINYMSGSAVIYAASSTNSGNNGSNWRFVPCNEWEFNGIDIEGLNID